jgi:hypothetical protein
VVELDERGCNANLSPSRKNSRTLRDAHHSAMMVAGFFQSVMLRKKQDARIQGLNRVEKYVPVGTDMREVVWTYIKKTINTAISSAAMMDKFSNPMLRHTTHQ